MLTLDRSGYLRKNPNLFPITIPRVLERGAEAFGFRGDIWTRARIAAVIKREFGVSYHRDHIGRLLSDICLEWA